MEDKKTTPVKTPVKRIRYVEGIGRRKTSVARVRLVSEKHAGDVPVVVVNDKQLTKYFPLAKHVQIVIAPFGALSLKDYSVSVHVSGGGVTAQAEAIRLGASRALIELNPIWRSKLKALGYLKRDARMVERKKAGMRKARRPQQWRKR
jgi:small subunit ribosomal protein S9